MFRAGLRSARAPGVTGLKRIVSFFLLLVSTCTAQNLRGSYSIAALAGSGSRGDGGPALEALLDGASGLAEDAEGNVYISEVNAGLIRRVRPDGVIERFAGTGTVAAGEAGRPALETDLSAPGPLLIDREGSLVFADNGACRIRKVLPDGIVRDLVGTGRCAGSAGFFPGGGSTGLRDRPAAETDLGTVGGMVLDGAGRLIFSDSTNHAVRRLDADGVVRTIAGTGTAGSSGDDDLATSAYLQGPAGLAFDAAGNLFIADELNCKVRRVDTEGKIQTVVGSGSCAKASAAFVAGTATRTTVGNLTALAYDPDTDSLLIACPPMARVVRYEPIRLRVSSFLGNGLRGAVETDKPGEFRLDKPSAILVSARYGTLVADATSFRVLQIRGESLAPFAGSWPQLDSYPSASSARLVHPRGLCLNPEGALIIADAGAGRILSYRAPDQLDAVAGARYPVGYSAGDDGSALAAVLNQPDRVACAPNGDVYLSEGTEIRLIDREGVIRAVLGDVEAPTGLLVDPEGRLLYSESGSHRVLRYDPADGSVTLIAGTEDTAGFSGDGGKATEALLNSPGDLALDSSGNLLIADRGNRRVRRVTPAGIITTVAGSSRGFPYADPSGDRATEVGLGRIEGMAVDAAGRIYISDSGRLSVVGKDGRFRVLTGFIGEDDDGRKLYLDEARNGCDGLAVDAQGRLYFSLRQEGRVMLAEPVNPQQLP